MDKMMRPAGVTPMPSATIARFMAVYDELCPTVDDEVPVEVFAERLGWPLSSVLTVAEWCRDRYLIDTDAVWASPSRSSKGVTASEVAQLLASSSARW